MRERTRKLFFKKENRKTMSRVFSFFFCFSQNSKYIKLNKIKSIQVINF